MDDKARPDIDLADAQWSVAQPAHRAYYAVQGHDEAR